jgi:hypothetical protein
MGTNFLRFNGVVLSEVGDVPVYSNMFIGVGECTCVASV